MIKERGMIDSGALLAFIISLSAALLIVGIFAMADCDKRSEKQDTEISNEWEPK